MLALLSMSCRNAHTNKALMLVKKVQSAYRTFRLAVRHWRGVTAAMLTLRVI